MTSIRNIEEAPSTSERLLDAARESILSVGWKRTTLTDVARRAGVSRMTVYRAYPDMASLFGDLMTREWAIVGDSLEGPESADVEWAEQIARRVVGMVAGLRANELFHRIVDVDPELLLPYLLDRRGRSQQAVLDLLTARIDEAQRAGGVRDGDPERLARSVLLTAHGFVLSHHTMSDERVTEADLDAELAELTRRYLAP